MIERREGEGWGGHYFPGKKGAYLYKPMGGEKSPFYLNNDLASTFFFPKRLLLCQRSCFWGMGHDDRALPGSFSVLSSDLLLWIASEFLMDDPLILYIMCHSCRRMRALMNVLQIDVPTEYGMTEGKVPLLRFARFAVEESRGVRKRILYSLVKDGFSASSEPQVHSDALPFYTSLDYRRIAYNDLLLCVSLTPEKLMTYLAEHTFRVVTTVTVDASRWAIKRYEDAPDAGYLFPGLLRKILNLLQFSTRSQIPMEGHFDVCQELMNAAIYWLAHRLTWGYKLPTAQHKLVALHNITSFADPSPLGNSRKRKRLSPVPADLLDISLKELPGTAALYSPSAAARLLHHDVSLTKHSVLVEVQVPYHTPTSMKPYLSDPSFLRHLFPAWRFFTCISSPASSCAVSVQYVYHFSPTADGISPLNPRTILSTLLPPENVLPVQ